jgi:hypothetical protein
MKRCLANTKEIYACNRSIEPCSHSPSPPCSRPRPSRATRIPSLPRSRTPTATTSRASDAVSARATTRETGRIKAPTTSTAGATGTGNANPGRGNWWADADIDGDGKLSIGEAKVQAGLEARFSTVDADADGFVTNDEYRKFFTDAASQGEVNASAHSAVVTRDLWTQLDGNSDGKLSATEVSANSGIKTAFTVMDSNGDGFVTQAEYTAYVKADMKNRQAGAPQACLRRRPAHDQGSSLTMVPMAVPSTTVAPVTWLTVAEKVSFGSFTESPLSVTEMLFEMAPAAIVFPTRLMAV